MRKLKLNLAQKLWLSLFLCLAAMAAILVPWFLASVNDGFRGYLEQQQQNRLYALKPQLEQYFQEAGSWQGLLAEPELWARLQHESWQPAPIYRGPKPDNRLSASMSEQPGPPHERRPARGPNARNSGMDLLLADHQHRILLGAQQALRGQTRWLALEQAGQTVGYVGYNLPRYLESVAATSFLDKQAANLLAITLAALLISGLVAFALARWLARPIKHLQAITQELGKGNYQARAYNSGQDEVAELARHLNELAGALEANEQSRRQWGADIAHELRTPLTFIQGQIEALQDGVRPASAEHLEALALQAKGLGKLVDDLYQLSLSELGGLNYKKQWYPAAELLGEALAQTQEAITAKGLTLTSDLRLPTDTRLYCDKTRMLQLLTNLLVNSLKYTSAPGQIHFSAWTDNARLFLCLQDSAPGVAEADLPRLSERLFRCDSSRNSATPGAGIGLALCRNITVAHNGTIHFTQSELGGLSVTLSLPR